MSPVKRHEARNWAASSEMIPLVSQPIDLLRVELEAFQGLENSAGSGHDTEAASGGQAAPKQLKRAATMRGAILQGGVEHRELVHISQQ